MDRLNRISVELGGGRDPKPGFLNLDVSPGPAVDVVCDFGVAIPLLDCSVDRIYSNHCLEHLADQILIMNEIWRVLKWGGAIEIIVPWYNCLLAFQDPTHKSWWTEQTQTFFDGAGLKKRNLDYGIRCCFKFDEVELIQYRNPGDIAIKYVADKSLEYYKSIGYPPGL